jgi:hypothetical protein
MAKTNHKAHAEMGTVMFQSRYKPILCQEDAYLLERVRCIHLNPVRAGLVLRSAGARQISLQRTRSDFVETATTERRLT